jgi:hypothetical protein
MLLILSAALFPLGLLAIAASVQSAQQKNDQRRVETETRLEIKAQRLEAAFSRSILTIHTASAALGGSPPGSPLCAATLRRLEEAPVPARYAFYAAGRLRCASAGFAAGEALPAGRPGESRPEILPTARPCGCGSSTSAAAWKAVSDFARPTLHNLTYIPGTSPNFDLRLSQGAADGASKRICRRAASSRPSNAATPSPTASSAHHQARRPCRSPPPTCSPSPCRSSCGCSPP